MKRNRFLWIFIFAVCLTALFFTLFLQNGALWSSGDSPIEVRSVIKDSLGQQWAATKNGLFYQQPGEKFKQMPLPSLSHHPFPSIYALTIDTVYNRLWIGAWNHLYCYDLNKNRFITTPDSTIHRIVGLFCDSIGRVIALTERGQFRYTLNDTLPNGLAEHLDKTVYPKPSQIQFDTSSETIELSEKKNNNITILITIIIVVVLLLIAIKLRYNHKTTGKSIDIAITATPGIDFIERARKVVDDHIKDEDFGADIFAQEMAVSRAQLFRKLKAANGQTPKEFIDERRFALAEHLLKTTEKSMPDIALACGFSDVSNFRRSFMRRYGVTPSAFRETNPL